MAGNPNITQTQTAIICQTEGNGSPQLSALDSVDVRSISDDAFAKIATTDSLYQWYPADMTPPAPGSVVKPISVPLTSPGRWKVIASITPPGVFYQFIQNIALNTAPVPIQNPVPQTAAQAPILEFYNLRLSGTGAKTTVTAANQQILYENHILDDLFLIEPQRARVYFVQRSELAPTPFSLLDVADSAVLDATIVSLYAPSYQEVQYGDDRWHSRALRFVGTAVTVTDNGTGNQTTVTIDQAAAIAPWSGVLGAGNTTSGHDAKVTNADVFYIQDTASLTVRDSGSIRFLNNSATAGTIYWVAGGTGTHISYSGTGADANAAPLEFAVANHSGGNAGAILRLSAASATAGGAAVFTLGAGTSNGGSFVTYCGNATTQGGSFIVYTGTGTATGNVTFNLGSGGTAGDFSVNGGAGSVQASNIRFTAGNGTALAGSIYATGGTGDPQGGGCYFTTGAGISAAGVGGPFRVTTGIGATAGNFEVNTGNGLGPGGYGGYAVFTLGSGAAKGGNFQVYCGSGTATGGDFEVILGGGTTTSGGVYYTFSGSAGTAGDFTIAGASGNTKGTSFSFTGGTSINSPGNFTVVAGDGATGVSGGRIILRGGPGGSPAPLTPTIFTIFGVYNSNNGYAELNTSLLLDIYPLAASPAATATGGHLYAARVGGGAAKLFWKDDTGAAFQISP